MADITYQIKVQNSDGTVFSSGHNAGALLSLRNSTVAGANTSEYTGNVAGSGDFNEAGNGLWYIGIDEEDSGYFLVQSSTGAGWTNVTGYAPIHIQLESSLALDGGEMSGNIVMGDNDITGVGDITFTNNAVGTIGTIVSGNLVDKADTEEITGNWSHTGDLDITKDKLKIATVAVTTTAAELNMLDGLTTTETIMTTAKGTGSRKSSYATGDSPVTLTNSLAGFIEVDTSGGAVNIAMPAISATYNPKFIISISAGGNNCTITDHAVDAGFSLANGDAVQASAGSIIIDAKNDFVILESSGVVAGYWAVIGGYNVDLL